MNTDQILSFEEFSTRGTGTATAEAPTTDTATIDTDDTVTDTETTDTENTDTEETKEEGKVTEEDAETPAEEPMTEPTVAEMYKKIGEACKNEAMAYDADEYAEHTKDTYITEMATLAAETTCNAIQKIHGESGTKEQFEATCNSVREAYAKKCNEACESYGTSENETQDNEPIQGPENSVIAKN